MGRLRMVMVASVLLLACGGGDDAPEADHTSAKTFCEHVWVYIFDSVKPVKVFGVPEFRVVPVPNLPTWQNAVVLGMEVSAKGDFACEDVILTQFEFEYWVSDGNGKIVTGWLPDIKLTLGGVNQSFTVIKGEKGRSGKSPGADHTKAFWRGSLNLIAGGDRELFVWRCDNCDTLPKRSKLNMRIRETVIFETWGVQYLAIFDSNSDIVGSVSESQ